MDSPSETTTTRKIWVLIKRLDTSSTSADEVLHTETVTDLYIPVNADALTVQDSLRQACGVQSDRLVLKLRNHRGSLIPISEAIASNGKSVPYILEIVERHQYVTPKPRTIQSPNYHETIRITLERCLQRLDKLEAVSPEFRERRQEKIDQDMEDLDKKLMFLNKRLSEAEHTRWQGMFKKHPLW